jgi:hypothetical protein
MSNKQLAQAQKLGQKRTTWYVISEPAPAWVGEEETKLTRPILSLVMDLEADMVRKIEMTETQPDGPELVKIVLDAMLKPGGGARGKFRPTMIQTPDAAVLARLQPLSELGIYCEKKEKPAQVSLMLHDLEEHLMGRPPLPGLLTVPGVTAAMLADFYAAAADYFRAAPWRHLDDSQPIAICCPPEADPVYLVVMGNAEETFGLAMYDDYQDLVATYSEVPPELMPAGSRWVSVMYDYPHYIPFAELDTINAHRWPIVADNAYPLLVALLPGESDVELPTAAEIKLATMALRAVPHFIDNYLDEDLEPIWDAGAVGYPVEAENPDFTLGWADDDLELGQFANLMAGSVSAVEEFIDGWEFDDDDFDEAFQLGSFLYSFVHLHRLHAEDELAEEQLDYVEDVLWELGALVMNYADRPLDPMIFTGPVLFADEYAEEWADDEADVEMYKMLWQNLGDYHNAVNAHLATLPDIDDAEEGEEDED